MSDTFDALRYYNRVYPYYETTDGAGGSLEGTTRTAPEGFTLDIEENYIQDDTGVEWVGRPVARIISFRFVESPDELFDAVLQELKDLAKWVQEQTDKRLI